VKAKILPLDTLHANRVTMGIVGKRPDIGAIIDRLGTNISTESEWRNMGEVELDGAGKPLCNQSIA
jgi:hypothetical protein